MTLLTHPSEPLQRAAASSEERKKPDSRAAAAGLAHIKQLCMCAFTILLTVGILVGGIALKAAVYLSRLNY